MKVKKGRETGSDKKTEETGVLNAAYKPGLDPELGRIAMKDILDNGKKAGGEGIQDSDLREIQELIDTTPEELTEDDLMVMSASRPMPMSTNIRQSGRRVLIIQGCF